MAIIATTDDSADDSRDIAIDLPITAKEIAIVLGIEPHRIVSDLMRNGVFANYYTEITDAKIIKEIGVRHGVSFRIRT